MTTQKTRSGGKGTDISGFGDGANNGNEDNSPMNGFTGRYLVLMNDMSAAASVKALKNEAGLKVSTTGDYKDKSAWTEFLADDSDALVFTELGVAVVDAPPDQVNAVSIAAASDTSSIGSIEPERFVYAFSGFGAAPAFEQTPEVPLPAEPSIDLDYVRGFRDAVNSLSSRILGENGAGALPAGEIGASLFVDERDYTWGIQATRAAVSAFSGRGVRVAVLDTGFDLGHPDFAGRTVVTQSFIPGETVQDANGHGTHCIGTACGVRGLQNPSQLPRYGVAYEAEIFVGKVLSNAGSGTDGGILNGINWAVANGCAVISMSLGAAVSSPTQPFSNVYEHAAQRALAAGSLIIAAAGNESRRPHRINPVGHPANCPSIMAVGALDAQLGTPNPLQVSFFSCAGLNPNGGQVDIAAPGSRIRSSWPRPQTYRTIDGTSMATPHVAGIAALYAQAFPGQRGRALAQLLLSRARRLNLPSSDVGAGLVQAP